MTFGFKGDDDIVLRLRNTPNWKRESWDDWKSCTLTYDRTPFEAADKIEMLRRIIKGARIPFWLRFKYLLFGVF